MDLSKIDGLNILISSIIGLGLSYFAAYTYEQYISRRKKKELRATYIVLESVKNSFDWQHWNIIDGKISSQPINSFMRVKYSQDTTLHFEWIEADGNVKGNGQLIFDDSVRGKMFYFSFGTIGCTFCGV